MPSPTLSALMQAGYFRPRPSLYGPTTYRGQSSGRLRAGDPQLQALLSSGADIQPGIEYRSTAPSRPLDPGFRAGAGVRGLPESAGQPGGADISPMSWYGSDAEQRVLDSANKEGFEERWDAATLEKEQALLAQMREKENAGAKQNNASSSQTLPQFVRRTPTAPASGPGAYARGEGPFYQGGAFSGPHSAGMSFLQNWLNNSFGAGSRGYGGKSPGDPSNKHLGLSSTGGEGWGEGSGIGGASGEAAFEAMLARMERSRGGSSGGGAGQRGNWRALPKKV